jgi:hypothetical protein
MRGLAAVALATAVLGAVRSGEADDKKHTSVRTPSASSGPSSVDQRAPGTQDTASRTQAQASRPKEQGNPGAQQVQQADTIAEKANRAVVGDAAQNENNWAAAHPREAERREEAEGRANMQAEERRAQPEGRTNMQPEGRTSMQPGEYAPPPPVQEPGGFGGVVRDVTRSVDHPGNYTPFAIEINPLGLLVGGRLSFNAEWAPVLHHSIQVSPYIVHTTADVATGGGTVASQAFSGVGGEIGYRYYTGHRGMNGLFIGPSLIGGIYNAGLPGNSNQAFTNFGIAGDVGLQDIFFNHLVVGGGVGIEYLAVSHDFGDVAAGPSTIASSGFKPRLLFSAGFGF